MGLGTLGSKDTAFKMRYRWLFEIDSFSQGAGGALPALPPKASSRPVVNLDEIKVEHLIERVYFPGKGDWQTIELTLYDVTNTCFGNQIFTWLQRLYDPVAGTYTPVIDAQYKIPTSNLSLYDGCGNEIEVWYFENIYPTRIDWGTLDMEDSSFVTVDLTLRYDRAYVRPA